MLRGSFMARWVGAMPFAALVWVLALGAGCGDPVKPPTSEDKDAGVDTEPLEDVGVDAAVADQTDPAETDAGPADTGGDIVKLDTKDAAPTGCLSDDACKGKVAGIKPCEKEKCQPDGTCVAQKIPSACCGDSDCDDAAPCTTDKCDLATAVCENKPLANCCKDKLFLLNVGFEQGSFEGFKAGPGVGNVKWQLETKRAHSGKHSLYFGNECYTYDTSMTAATGCKSAGAGLAILPDPPLKSPEIIIPAGKNAILHYWLWMDAEPTWGKVLPKGTCAKCAEPSSCVDLGSQGGSQCFPEKDLLTVKVNGQVATPVWTSKQIDNTTGGQWRHYVINLTAGAASVSWEFKTTNGLKNNFEGIYLDDVVVETLCADDSTFCDAAKPCKDDNNPCTSEKCTDYLNIASTGICFHDKEPACCVGVTDCDDKNTCTVDSCKKASGASQGICTNKPDAENNQCCQAKDLMTEAFENGVPTWKHLVANSKTVKWQVAPQGGTGGSKALYFGDSTFTSYHDGTLPKAVGPKGTICTPPVQLQAGTLYNVAKFNLKMDTEWSGQPKDAYKNPPVIPGLDPAEQPTTKVDELRVTVISAFESPVLWSSDIIQGTTDGQFLPITVALDAYAGKKVELCFTFDAGDAANNTFAGVTIDDVEIDISCTQAETICVADGQCILECAAKACTKPLCKDGACTCEPIPGCCAVDLDCDDKDTCTADKCNALKCENKLTSDTCCSEKPSLYAEGFENDAGATPGAWVIKTLTGNAQGGLGNPYDQTIKWSVSALKAAEGNWSLYFGNNGTYNAGTNVPAAIARSPEVAIPKNGTTLVTFDVFLSTEWNGTAFQEPPAGIVVDRMRVGLYDPTQTDPAKATVWTWTSYGIGGTTNNKFLPVVAAVPSTWQGKKVRIVFEFDAGHEKSNNYEGAYVDKIQVATVCDKPICIADTECVPGNPDACKKYFCAKDPTKLAFECKTDDKAGPNCCVPSVALPLETAEAGFASWTGYSDPPNSAVKWQTVAHKYLSGKQEIYFGNPAAWNYDEPGKAVSGELVSKPFKLADDMKKSAFLQFKAWLDVESSYETFRVTATYTAGTQPITDVLWTKKEMLLGEYKAVIDRKIDLSKYKGKGNIVVKFEFNSDDASKNDKFSGIFLDDIQVAEPCL